MVCKTPAAERQSKPQQRCSTSLMPRHRSLLPQLQVSVPHLGSVCSNRQPGQRVSVQFRPTTCRISISYVPIDYLDNGFPCSFVQQHASSRFRVSNRRPGHRISVQFSSNKMPHFGSVCSNRRPGHRISVQAFPKHASSRFCVPYRRPGTSGFRSYVSPECMLSKHACFSHGARCYTFLGISDVFSHFLKMIKMLSMQCSVRAHIYSVGQRVCFLQRRYCRIVLVRVFAKVW